MKWILRLLLRTLFQLKVLHLGRLPSWGPAIILPNHVSFLDAIILFAYLPHNTYFVVNTAMAKKIKIILRYVHHVTIDPLNPYSLKKVVNLLRAGTKVVIFPEGRISTTGNLMKVYGGVALIAMKTRVPLCPVILLGPERSKFSRITDKTKSRWFPNISLYIGEVLESEVFVATGLRQQKKILSDHLLALLQQAMFKAKQELLENSNIFHQVLQAKQRYGAGKMMARDPRGAITYGKAIIASYALSRSLGATLTEQSVVGLLLPNSIGHLVTLLSLSFLGKTPAILNFSAGVENNMYCSEIAGLKTILTSRLFVEKGNLGELIAHLSTKYKVTYLEDLKEQITWLGRLVSIYQYCSGADALAENGELILFTSGSENKPKGVLLSHANIVANINQISCVIDYLPHDSMLNAMPMFHSFGLTAGTLLPLFSGIEVFLYPTPLHYTMIPEMAYEHNITLLLGTPTFLKGYAKHGHHYDFHRLRYALAGGEKLTAEVRQLWLDKYGIRILEGYGTTETAPVLSLNTPLFYRTNTVGRLLPGIEMRVEPVAGIVEGGNLLVRGPNVMKGYLLYKQGFVPAPEWYDCGDIVTIDRSGFLTIQSRLKRFAKISGEMVSLDAVEQTAQGCFGTNLHAAISLPDGRKGEKIVLYTTSSQASKQQLRRYWVEIGQNMISLPSEVVIRNDLPLLGSGKINYVRLREMALQKVAKDT